MSHANQYLADSRFTGLLACSSQACWFTTLSSQCGRLATRWSIMINLQFVDSQLTTRWLASHNTLAHTLVLLVRDCFKRNLIWRKCSCSETSLSITDNNLFCIHNLFSIQNFIIPTNNSVIVIWLSQLFVWKIFSHRI